MSKAKSATIKRGHYKGDELSVDHIVPHSLALELDNIVANLELLPLRVNQSKGDKMGARQRDYARKFNGAGLLTMKRLKEISPGK